MEFSSELTNGIVSIVSEFPETRTYFEHLAQRKRRTDAVDIYRMYLNLKRSGLFLPMDRVLAMFERFERLRLGDLDKPKAPAHPSFRWRFDSKEVARIALKALSGRVKVKPYPTPQPTRQSSPNGAANDFIRVMLPVGDDFVPFDLPRTFSRRDAEAMGRALIRIAEQNEG